MSEDKYLTFFSKTTNILYEYQNSILKFKFGLNTKNNSNDQDKLSTEFLQRIEKLVIDCLQTDDTVNANNPKKKTNEIGTQTDLKEEAGVKVEKKNFINAVNVDKIHPVESDLIGMELKDEDENVEDDVDSNYTRMTPEIPEYDVWHHFDDRADFLEPDSQMEMDDSLESDFVPKTPDNRPHEGRLSQNSSMVFESPIGPKAECQYNDDDDDSSSAYLSPQDDCDLPDFLQIETLNMQIDCLNDQLEHTDKKIKTYHHDLHQSKEAIIKEKTERQKSVLKLRNLRKEYDQLKKDYDDDKFDYSACLKENEKIKDENDRITLDYLKLQERHESIRDYWNEDQKKSEKLLEENNQLLKKLKDIEENLHKNNNAVKIGSFTVSREQNNNTENSRSETTTTTDLSNDSNFEEETPWLKPVEKYKPENIIRASAWDSNQFSNLTFIDRIREPIKASPPVGQPGETKSRSPQKSRVFKRKYNPNNNYTGGIKKVRISEAIE